MSYVAFYYVYKVAANYELFLTKSHDRICSNFVIRISPVNRLIFCCHSRLYKKKLIIIIGCHDSCLTLHWHSVTPALHRRTLAGHHSPQHSAEHSEFRSDPIRVTLWLLRAIVWTHAHRATSPPATYGFAISDIAFFLSRKHVKYLHSVGT